ncbi:MAG: hypothetical protein HFH45_04420 [Bacilli bacterium]|nr:hypothetical protein [Bacilli bacterium]
MRRNRKRKKQRKIIIASVISLLFVMTVGYAAFQTNLNITAKGNITSKGITPQELKNTFTTQGEGLYKDTTEDGRYIYKGKNPNNYITFNGEEWRIIAIEKDNTVKIIRTEGVGGTAFDPGYVTNIPGITIANSVEGTRYSNSSTDYCHYSDANIPEQYNGCNVWGSKSTMLNQAGVNITSMPKEVGSSQTYTLPEKEAYINTYLNGEFYNNLNEKSQKLVETHLWNVGIIKNQDGQTLETDLSQEKAYKWRGKVALLNTTDYVKSNTNTEMCGSINLNYDTGSYETCKTTNWLSYESYNWTMSAYSQPNRSRYVWTVYHAGHFMGNSAQTTYGFHPALYLSSNIHLKGDGTSDSPFIINEER